MANMKRLLHQNPIRTNPTVGNLAAFTVSSKECDHLHTDMKLYTILQLLISITHNKGK
jgi:hypothetical protein